MMQLLSRQVTGNEQQMVTENRYICSCILCWGLGYSSQSCIIYVQGLEAAVDHGEDDALGIMQHLHEQSASAYCEAEEVLARPPPPAVSVECMASPLSGYQAQSDANPNPHDCKENMRVGSDDIDLGTSASVNWFSVSLLFHCFKMTDCVCMPQKNYLLHRHVLWSMLGTGHYAW
jgi:hypothetical protein